MSLRTVPEQATRPLGHGATGSESFEALLLDYSSITSACGASTFFPGPKSLDVQGSFLLSGSSDTGFQAPYFQSLRIFARNSGDST